MKQITDIDGNTYKTVKIGKQEWMAENLNVSHYCNGDPIPKAKDEWSKLKTGAWCYYDHDEENGKIYGKLYNGYAVYDPRGLAPEGWHVSTDNEWKILMKYLGGEDIAGDKLKEPTYWWVEDYSVPTNESGFTALPGGLRDSIDDNFKLLDQGGYWVAFIEIKRKTYANDIKEKLLLYILLWLQQKE